MRRMKRRQARKDARHQETGDNEDHSGSGESSSESDSDGGSAASLVSTGKPHKRSYKYPAAVEQQLAEFFQGYPLIYQTDHEDHCKSDKRQQVYEIAAKKFNTPG